MKKKYIVDAHTNASGKRFGVHFREGKAEGEFHEYEANEMKSWGYTVEEVVEKKEVPKKAPVKKQTKE